MYVSGGGYSSAQFDNKRLRALAKDCSRAIPYFMQKWNADAIVVQGKSGMSAAFATQMLIDFPLVVVRKRGEDSHGSKIEGTPNVNFGRYLILDDFIDTGATVERIRREIQLSWDSMDGAEWCGNNKPELVGVLEWMLHYSGERIFTLQDRTEIQRVQVGSFKPK